MHFYLSFDSLQWKWPLLYDVKIERQVTEYCFNNIAVETETHLTTNLLAQIYLVYISKMASLGISIMVMIIFALFVITCLVVFRILHFFLDLCRFHRNSNKSDHIDVRLVSPTGRIRGQDEIDDNIFNIYRFLKSKRNYSAPDAINEELRSKLEVNENLSCHLNIGSLPEQYEPVIYWSTFHSSLWFAIDKRLTMSNQYLFYYKTF